MRKGWTAVGIALVVFLAAASPLMAQDAAAAAGETPVPLAAEAAAESSGPSMALVANTLWVMVAAFLVFWMNAGFAMVETGFCRAKNAVNILAKNFVVFAIASLAFYVIGFGLMFGDGNPILGTTGFLIASPDDNSASFTGAEGEEYTGSFGSLSWAHELPLLAKFFFQLVFAGTAATIVSGAVAERIHFLAFILFSFFLVAVVYPIAGHWIWGGGFLADGSLGEGMVMYDFAGSTVVHSIGGWAALAGVLLLGPRLGKYQKDGSVRPIPGHNLGFATLGGLILWLGWFGFNPGSTMQANGEAIAHIALTTNLAAAAGTITALLTARLLLGSYDLSMIINGTLAGLVAITAPCAFVSMPFALLIGAVAGVLVVVAVLAFDRAKIDDPVGALSVHLVNGVWGTLALGLFADEAISGSVAGFATQGLLTHGSGAQFVTQLIGVLLVGGFVFLASLGFWGLLKATIGIRVSAEEEMRGLDLSEMGMEAYPADPVVTPVAHARAASAPAASPQFAAEN